jgi:hypothetical protein
MEEERPHCRVKERKTCSAMKQMFATAVGGPFAALNKHANNEDKDDDEDEEQSSRILFKRKRVAVMKHQKSASAFQRQIVSASAFQRWIISASAFQR